MHEIHENPINSLEWISPFTFAYKKWRKQFEMDGCIYIYIQFNFVTKFIKENAFIKFLSINTR